MSQRDLSCFDNLTGLDASGADLHSSIAAGRQLDADRLKIRIKPSAGLVVCMGYIISKLRAFPANVTAFCHNIASPNKRGIRESLEKLETRFITN